MACHFFTIIVFYSAFKALLMISNLLETLKSKINDFLSKCKNKQKNKSQELIDMGQKK